MARRRWWGAALVGGVAVVVGGCSPPLDGGFGGGDGIVTIAGPSIATDQPAAVAGQADGRIVLLFVSSGVGSSYTIARFHPEGTLDTSFDGDGRLEIPSSASPDCGDILVQPDGKYVVSVQVPNFDGSQNRRPGLARYHPDGSQDMTFGRSGMTSVPDIEPCDLEIQPDGKIVASARTFAGAGMQAVRFLPDGSVDTGFGSDGLARLRVPHVEIMQNTAALALQPDGKIVVVGSAREFQDPVYEHEYSAVARFNTDGTPDTSFAGQGGVIQNLGGPAADVVVRPDGRIVIAGHVEPRFSGTGEGRFQVAQFTPSGALDPAFGTGGVVRAVDDGVGKAMALLDDGKVVVAGREFLPNHSSSTRRDGFTSIRVSADGTLDESYVPGGIGNTDHFEGEEWGTDVAIAADGDVLVAGTVPAQDPTTPPDSSWTDVGLYRYDVG